MGKVDQQGWVFYGRVIGPTKFSAIAHARDTTDQGLVTGLTLFIICYRSHRPWDSIETICQQYRRQ